MKILKYAFPIAAIALFMSCSSDDPETPPPGGSGGNNNPPTPPTEEFSETYNAVYGWGWLDQEGKPDGEPTFLITPTITEGSSENEWLITGLFPTNGKDFPMDASQPIVATFNKSANTVTINSNQILGTNSKLVLRWGTVADDGSADYVPVASLTGTIDSNGNIEFPVESAFLCSNSNETGSYYWMNNLLLQPYDGSYKMSASQYAGQYSSTFEWYTEDSNGDFFTPSYSSVNPIIVVDNANQYKLQLTNMYPTLGDNAVSVEATILPSGDLKIQNVQTWDVGNFGFQLLIITNNDILPDYAIMSLNADGSLSMPNNWIFSAAQYRIMSNGTGNFMSLYGYKSLVLKK